MINNRNILIIAIFLFFVVNMLQAIFTPVLEDEAYYWVYALQPDWGFFDHPPMVALLIIIGKLFFGGTIGLRLVTAVMMIGTVYLTWKLIPLDQRKRKGSQILFLLIILSSPLINVYGFITTPDVPLLFFSALYLYVFNHFIEKQNILNALKLGLVASLLMYSKYHGAFLIIFSFLPWLRLLLNRYFLLAAITGITLYMPHLYWQFENDFVSFRYHLYERTDGFMNGKHLIVYLINIFVVFNPLFFGLFLYKRFKKKQIPVLPKTYGYVLWGFILLNGLIAFRDHVEPQWLVVAVIPFVIMIHGIAVDSGNLKKLIKSFAYISFSIILISRVLILSPFEILPSFYDKGQNYHDEIREMAGESNLIFINSYIDPAKHTFYTGYPAYSYNCYTYRKNQYDIWDYEDTYHNSSIFLVTEYDYPWADSVIFDNKHLRYVKKFEKFPMINKLKAIDININQILYENTPGELSFTLKNPYDYDIDPYESNFPISFHLVFFEGHTRLLYPLKVEKIDLIKKNTEMSVSGSFDSVPGVNKYELVVAVQQGSISPVIISKSISVEVK